MKHFEEYMKATDYSLTESVAFAWECYPESRFYDCENQFAYASMIYNMREDIIHEIVLEPKNGGYYRYSKNPEETVDDDHEGAIILNYNEIIEKITEIMKPV